MADQRSSTQPAGFPRGRTVHSDPAVRELALRVLARYSETDAGAHALATAAERSYQDLIRVVAPLIGDAGADALTGRALHLAAREHPCLAGTRQQQGVKPFAQVIACLEQQDPCMGTAAAAAVFAHITELLGTFIGEALTQRLLRKAWPDAFTDAAYAAVGQET